MLFASIGALALSAGHLFPSVAAAAAFNWNFTSTPKQCDTLSLSASGGKAPYHALIIPFGPSPLGSVEARRVTDIPFNDSSSLSFPLNFPKGSQFVMVVSDANGFGTGGASAPMTVQGGDDGCFDTKNSVSTLWYIGLNPVNQLVQCSASRIWWDPSKVQGDPYFVAVIPGGNTFRVPQSGVNDIVNFGRGFNYTPNIATGTNVLLVGGDDRFLGSGGSVSETVNGGERNDVSCLSSDSPSTTGTPAGASSPTTTSNQPDPSNSAGGKHKSNIGAIVGGVVGGLAGLLALLLLGLFCLRRRRFHKQQKERPVDLLQDGERDSHDGDLPQYYRPDPYVVPDPSAGRPSTGGALEADALLAGGGAAAADASTVGRPSAESSSHQGAPSAWGYGGGGGGAQSSRPRTPDRTSTSAHTRKSGAGPGPLRPVNIYQHEDARRVEAPKAGGEDEPETIELPPAYTHIKRGASVREPGTAEGPVEPPTGVQEGSTVPAPPAQAPTAA